LLFELTTLLCLEKALQQRAADACKSLLKPECQEGLVGHSIKPDACSKNFLASTSGHFIFALDVKYHLHPRKQE
jgi:hypothetical protein